VRAATGIDTPYLLAVGTLEPRKNLLTLLHAYAALPPSVPPLVLTGSPGWGNQTLATTLATLNLGERVRFTGYVADEVLPALYSAAELFLYPSLYEGFGLPVLEAMACGAPVITSSTSSLPEVAGAAAVLIDPQRADHLAEAIQTLLETPDQRARLREAGLARAQTFSWDRCAQDTVNVYRQVLGAA
jgi:glycosyltransferase involved in cell wall biosynthesis